MIFTPLASSSAGNAYLVEDGETRLLLECGLTYKKLQKALGFSVSGLSACLVTHEHKDHSKCHKDLLKSGIPVYASPGTADALDCREIHTLPHSERGYTAFSIGTFDVLPFATFHDAAEPVGFLIRSRTDGDKLMFATDTVNLGYRFPGLTVLALECNYAEELIARNRKLPEKVRRRIVNCHMEVHRACDYLGGLDLSGVRMIYLLHLSDSSADEGLFVDLVERACPGVKVVACPKEAEMGWQHGRKAAEGGN